MGYSTRIEPADESSRRHLRAISVIVFFYCLASIGEPPQSRAAPPSSSTYAEIRVLDKNTGRGVPLVELETVNGLKFVTDNAGRIALMEPALMGRETFFFVRSHGYAVPKDGFGIVGVRVTPQPGQPAEIKIERRNVAERLCRLTGEGLYRDTLLLGYKSPLAESPHPGRVAGQDTIQAAVYRNKVYCFWGDTTRMEYPLGLFRTAGATTAVPNPNDLQSDPAAGIVYDYFTDPKTGFVRAMMPLAERPEGVVWVTAVFVVPDNAGRERLVAHYTRRRGLDGEFEQGIALYNDDKNEFEVAVELPLEEKWRRPMGHPIFYEAEGKKWVLFGSPTPNVRVPATLENVLDKSRYEAFACADPERPSEPKREADGRPVWRWQKELPPTGANVEQRWVKEKKIRAEDARFCPVDAAGANERIQLHTGTVRWNEHRRKWVLIAGQSNGTSHLGEVWYAESDSATGPFPKAVKVVTHEKQTFYNVCQHAFLDRDGGRTIHFEGTYTNDFSGNPEKTPRYNYNQVLYRLDVDAVALEPARNR